MVVIEPFDGANIIQTFLDATRVIKSFRPGDGSFEQWKGFTGKEYDPETGLYYFNARWYDQSIGRFISEDPVRDPNNPNLYTYARNNPLRFIDPTGLISLADIGLSTATTGLSSKELNEIQIDKPNSSAPKPPTPPSTSANPADFRRLEQELSKISSGMPPDPTPELPKDGPRTSDEWEKRWFEAQENEDIATLGKLLEERYQGFVYDPNIITPLATQFYAYQQGDREPVPIIIGLDYDLFFEGTSRGLDLKNQRVVYSKSFVSSLISFGPYLQVGSGDFAVSIGITKQTSCAVLWSFTESGRSAQISGYKVSIGPSLAGPINITINRPDEFNKKEYNVWPW